MKTIEFKIFHFGHSSVAVETENSFLIFDYYYDTPVLERAEKGRNFLTIDDLKTHKPVFVFVSHSHGDHFNPEIFQWKEINRNIKYILSYDIKALISKEEYYYMEPYTSLQLDDIHIKSFGTTDKGVSFLVDVDNITLFHAGDLNWWHWKSFTAKELKQEEVDFKREVSRIIGESIDIAFIPVDPRLEEFSHLAALYFSQTLHPKLLVPIHFRDDFSICDSFSKKLDDTVSVKVAKFTDLGGVVTFRSNL